MRNILIFFLFIFLVKTNSFCQSLPDTSATWTIASIGWGSYFANETFEITGDTTINSNIYKSVYTTKDSIYNPLISNYFCAMRELNNKWYFIPADSTKEFMLYDFDVKTGDTVSINNPWAFGEIELIVFDIDSLELNDNYYKNIALGFIDSYSGRPYVFDQWIEGIGSTQGFCFSGLNMVDMGYQLLCFHRNDSLIYLNSPDGTCGYLSTGIETNSIISDFKLSPNPVLNQLNIISNHDLVVEIYDISGKKIITSYEKIINVSHLVNGIYVAKIFDTKMKYIKSEKIVKQ